MLDPRRALRSFRINLVHRVAVSSLRPDDRLGCRVKAVERSFCILRRVLQRSSESREKEGSKASPRRGSSERATSRWRVPDSAPSRRIDDIGCVYCHEAESPRLKKTANPCIRDYLFDEAFDEAGVPRWTEFAYQGTAIRYTEENVG